MCKMDIKEKETEEENDDCDFYGGYDPFFYKD